MIQMMGAGRVMHGYPLRIKAEMKMRDWSCCLGGGMYSSASATSPARPGVLVMASQGLSALQSTLAKAHGWIGRLKWRCSEGDQQQCMMDSY
jgi:hypothetical protein